MKIKLFCPYRKAQNFCSQFNDVITVKSKIAADCILIISSNKKELKKKLNGSGNNNVTVWWQGAGTPGIEINKGRVNILFCRTADQLKYAIDNMYFEKSLTDDVKPLTGLPGNRSIHKKLEEISDDKDKVAVYLDLTDFKPYNEVYGFSAGDSVIVGFSELLKKICSEFKEGALFLGHIGGDDFIAVIHQEFIKKFFNKVDTEFLNIRDSFYEEGDIARGSIVGWDRTGQKRKFNLMGICGVGFSPKKRNLNSARKISEFATYLKDSAKSLRNEDNIFITPEDIKIVNKPPEKFLTDRSIPLYHRRTFVEAMGESGFAHYGSILTKLLNKHIEDYMKKSIIYALGRLRYTPAEKVILKYANDNNPHLRMRAVEALGNFGRTDYINFIKDKLNDSNKYVAVAAARSMAAIGHPHALKYLKNMDKEASGWVKIELAIARSRLGDRTVTLVIANLLNDPDPVFRKKASRSLENIPGVHNFLLLYSRLKKEKDKYVKNTMIISAARIATKVRGSKIKKIGKKIWKLYRRTPPNLRSYVLPALGRLKTKKAQEALKTNLKSKKSWVRAASLQGLGEVKRKETRELIRRKLNDYSARVREIAAESMGNIEDINGLEYLRKSLKDKDKMVRKAASGSVINIIRNNYGSQRN